MTIPLAQVAALVDAITKALVREFPGLDLGECFSFANSSVTLRCSRCGVFSKDAVSMLYLAGSGMTGGNVVFGGPNVAALGSARCPGCGSTTAEASFNSAKARARHATLTAAPVTSAGPAMSPCSSHPFIDSLTISPNGQKAAWVADATNGRFSIVIFSTSSGEQIGHFTHPAHQYPPKCLFVGNDHIAVASHPTGDLKLTRLTLYDAAGQHRLDEVDLGGYFSIPSARGDPPTVIAEGSNDILMIAVDSGKLRQLPAVRIGQIYSPGPRFGPDGNIYVIHHYCLYRVQGTEKVRLMSADHCLCMDPAGRVYAGGGYSDRSGASAVHVLEIASGSTFEIPWGTEPVDGIHLAGEGRILVSTEVDEVHAGRFPNATVTCVSVADRKRHWEKAITDLKAYRLPVLASAFTEGWALLQTGRLLCRVSVTDGSDLATAPKRPEEFLGAEWVPACRTLFVTRQSARQGSGIVELYRIDH